MLVVSTKIQQYSMNLFGLFQSFNSRCKSAGLPTIYQTLKYTDEIYAKSKNKKTEHQVVWVLINRNESSVST